MTKIKDLAVLAVENAFCQFPIDTERYELGRHIKLVSDHRLYEGGSISLIGLNWRTNQWLTICAETFRRCAADFWLVQEGVPDLRPIQLDRARRVEATFRFWLVDVRWERASVALPPVVEGYLWECLLRACRVTGDFSIDVPADEGVST